MTPPEQRSIADLLESSREDRLPVIVEVGAHLGEESAVFDTILDRCLHIMVEPDPRNIQTIIDHIHLGYFRRLLVGAISDSSGFKPFHFSDNSVDGFHSSGSLLEPTGHLKHSPHVTFPYTGMVMCYTLDEIFQRENLTYIDLLFTDVQGAEAAMIRGGQMALSHTQYLFMEVEHTEMYRGEALRDELIRMLPGWVLTRDFGNNVLMRNGSSVIG